ncbi:Uncharacterised protein [Staphylococcus gallinarum]|uniref:Uncharacterized protein n=1 Tax=Staphylococcus gallinarum TaxID=1293 RepID=A0A380FBR1_STAGA|nr:Uncharacterised protein [Staphylococcus gallinarum]
MQVVIETKTVLLMKNNLHFSETTTNVVSFLLQYNRKINSIFKIQIDNDSQLIHN